MRALLVLCVLATSIVRLAGDARADATPVGPLPSAPATTIVAERGSLVAIALPRQRPSSGLVWRLARPVDSAVLRQISEADVGPAVVIVSGAIGRGSAKVSFALTQGETGTAAIRAATCSIRVR